MKKRNQVFASIVTIILIGIGAFFVTDDEQTKGPSEDTKRTAVELERVVDGDTIIMREEGERKRMRLLLVDTPESNTQKTGKAQPFGKEAKEFLTEYLKGKELSIVYDPNHDAVDQYNRVLAYLYADDELVEEVLVREGLARVGYFNGKELYYDIINQAEKEAKADRKNIWSIKDYVGKKGFNEIKQENYTSY